MQSWIAMLFYESDLFSDHRVQNNQHLLFQSVNEMTNISNSEVLKEVEAIDVRDILRFPQSC